MGTSLKILTSFVAMASTWNDLPRFGANAMSWTASVTVISVSALAYFLFTVENKKKKSLQTCKTILRVTCKQHNRTTYLVFSLYS